MPFNTRNPIPSGDLRDLDDNARNIDTWANDNTKLSHPDRFGVERRTWHGIEQEANLNIQRAIDAKNAAQEAAMMSGFSKYADSLAQLEAGIGADYVEGDVVMVFQDESRGDTSSIFKIESGAAEFKLTFDKTRQDLLSFTGNISEDAEWSDVQAHSDPAFDVQVQALANRTEILNNRIGWTVVSDAISEYRRTGERQNVTEDVTVLIPADCSTLQEAFDALHSTCDKKITILIQSGHQLTKGLRVVGRDLREFEITSEDERVYLSSSFAYVISPEFPDGAKEQAVNIVNCSGLTLSVLVDANGRTDITGLGIITNSTVLVSSGKGFTGFGQNCQVRSGSRLHAPSTIWSDAQRECMQVTSGSFGEIRDSTFDDGFKDSANYASAINGALAVSRGSHVSGQGIRIRRSGCSAVTVRRSSAVFNEATFADVNYSGSVSGGAFSLHLQEGSNVVASGATYNGSALTTSDISVASFNTTSKDGIVFGSVDVSVNWYGLGQYGARSVNDGNVPPDFNGWNQGNGGTSVVATFPSNASRYWPIFNVVRNPTNATTRNAVRMFFESGSMYVRWFEVVDGVSTPVTKKVKFVEDL